MFFRGTLLQTQLPKKARLPFFRFFGRGTVLYTQIQKVWPSFLCFNLRTQLPQQIEHFQEASFWATGGPGNHSPAVLRAALFGCSASGNSRQLGARLGAEGRCGAGPLGQGIEPEPSIRSRSRQGQAKERGGLHANGGM